MRFNVGDIVRFDPNKNPGARYVQGFLPMVGKVISSYHDGYVRVRLIYDTKHRHFKKGNTYTIYANYLMLDKKQAEWEI